MSDEPEDISVEAESPVAGAGTEAVVAPVPVEASAEPMGEEVKATQVNIDAADNQQYAQKAYAENNKPDQVDAGPAVTLAGIADQEEAKKKKREQAEEHIIEAQKESAERREWLEREHSFGGQKMSGHDLDKLVNAYANNPQMQDKLRDRLSKSGMSKDKVDKTMKDFDEYMKILEKESKGQTLSDEEKRRRAELEKNRDVTDAAQQLTNITREAGIDYEFARNKDVRKAQSAGNKTDRNNAEASAENKRNNSADIIIADTNEFAKMAAANPALTGSAAGKAHFSTAPAMSDDFGAVSAQKLVASNDVKVDFAADVNVAIVAQAKTPPPKAVVALDTSFG